MILINEVNRLDLPRLIVRFSFFLILCDSDWMRIHYLTAYKYKLCSSNFLCAFTLLCIVFTVAFLCIGYYDYLVF